MLLSFPTNQILRNLIKVDCMERNRKVTRERDLLAKYISSIILLTLTSGCRKVSEVSLQSKLTFLV